MVKRLRYVVLHHTGITRPHFDLLFEIEPGADALTALRCPTWPAKVGDLLGEMAEHRLLYLDYEGPVSGDRGVVVGVESGDVHVSDLCADPPVLGLQLASAGGTTTDLTLVSGFDAADHSPTWTISTLAMKPR